MKFVDSGFEILEQGETMLDLYKHVERIARISYKSEDKITEDSARKMVDALVKNGHLACLEHGTIYLEVPYGTKRKDPSGSNWMFLSSDHLIPRIVDGYYNNPYSKVYPNPTTCCDYITTNARVLIENDWLDDLKYMCSPTKYHEKRYSVKFIWPIGIVRDALRHRKFSFMNESTR